MEVKIKSMKHEDFKDNEYIGMRTSRTTSISITW